MSLIVPKFGTKKEHFAYLVENKKELVAQKKQLVNSGDIMPNLTLSKEGTAIKNIATEAEEFNVTVLGNLSNWFDSHHDVMLPGNWNKSIGEKGTRIPILKDHNHSIEGRIAKTIGVRTEAINLSSIGITDSDIKVAEGLVFEFEPKKELNEKAHALYKAGDIDQHSIGLQYLQIELAINDSDFKEELAVYEKYFDQIINKPDVEKFGYFWAVKESKIFELSAVLFGSNVMTPVLDIQALSNAQPPKAGTKEETEPRKKSFYHLANKP
jgi:phage head maturation protease